VWVYHIRRDETCHPVTKERHVMQGTVKCDRGPQAGNVRSVGQAPPRAGGLR